MSTTPRTDAAIKAYANAISMRLQQCAKRPTPVDADSMAALERDLAAAKEEIQLLKGGDEPCAQPHSTRTKTESASESTLSSNDTEASKPSTQPSEKSASDAAPESDPLDAATIRQQLTAAQARADADLVNKFDAMGMIHEWTVTPPGKMLHCVGIPPIPPRHSWKWHTTLRAAIDAASEGVGA